MTPKVNVSDMNGTDDDSAASQTWDRVEEMERNALRLHGKKNMGTSVTENCGSALESRKVENMIKECHNAKTSEQWERAFSTNESRALTRRSRGLTHDSRATLDQVLDKRTVLLLEKLFKKEIFKALYGCINAGKEANVYLGCDDISKEENGKGTHNFCAIKVFRTSILSFKDRARYVHGEFRFRTGYMGSRNPRKMVTQWAEKEFRNLKRIMLKGIRCPVPLELRGHVFAMTYLGFPDGRGSPRLKDLLSLNCYFSTAFWNRIYVEVIAILRHLYHDCKLVHGDFSEYNILFHEGHCYVIDVSQSVEHDHPGSLEFLKRDCINVFRFFGKIITLSEAQDCTKLVDTEEGDSCIEESGIDKEQREDDEDESDSTELPLYCNVYDDIVEQTIEKCGESIIRPLRVLSPQELYYLVTCPVIPYNQNECEENNKESSAITDADEVNENSISPHDTVDKDDTVVCWPEFDDISDFFISVKRARSAFEAGERMLYAKSSTNSLEAVFQDITRHRNRFNKLCAKIFQFLLQPKKMNTTLDNTVEENVFLTNWTPSDLHQISSYKQLESLLDRHLMGEETMFDGLLARKEVDTKENETYETNLESKMSRSSPPYDRGSKQVDSDVNDDIGESVSEESGGNVNDEIEGSVDSNVEVKKFSGKIPQGMDAKEWKRKVKEEARLRRQSKVPKYVKRKQRQHKGQKKKK